MPFPGRFDAPRGYFALSGTQARARIEVQEFIAWLSAEAAAVSAAGAGEVVAVKPARKAKRSRGAAG